MSKGSDNRRGRDWARFLLGLIMLAATVLFFSSGITPPGICGEVLRHNQANHIDASPLLYSEVGHMAELEEGVRQLREAARERMLKEKNTTAQ